MAFVSCDNEFPLINNTASIILDFLFLRNQRLATIYACGTTTELVHLSHTLNGGSIRDYPGRYPSINIINLSTSNDIHLPDDGTAAVIDLRCGSKVAKVIDKCSLSWCFNEAKSWLAIANSSEDALKYFQNANLNLDTQLLFAVVSTDQLPWAIYDIYSLGFISKYPLNMTLYGYWLPSTATDVQVQAIPKMEMVTISKWQLFTADTWIRRRSDWQGMLIRAAVAITYKPPKGGFFKYLSTPVNVHLDTMHRHNYELYKYLMEIYNFQMSIIRTNTWGVVQNGSWSGVIGTLTRGEAELSITPIQFKMDRIGVVDHTAISWLARPCFIFRHPRVNEDAWLMAFARPFSLSVWIAAFAFMVLAVVVNHLTSKTKANQMTNDSEVIGNKVDNSWSYLILLWAVAACSQQGIMQDCWYSSGRVATLSLLLFCLITYQFYSAFLVSSLLMEPTRTITTLGDLLDSNLNIAIEDIAYNWDYFDESHFYYTPSILKKLFKKKIAPAGKKPNAYLPEEGLERVRKGGWAFHVDVATAYKIIAETFDDSAICDLTEIQLFPPKETVTIVRKGSPFRQPLAVGLRLQQTGGVLSHSRRVWHAPRPTCVRSGMSALEAAGPDDVAFLPLMLMLGGIASAIALGIERYRFKVRQPSPIWIE